MLMGLDFMKQYNCAIDIVNNLLIINEEELTLNCEGNIGCHRVVAKEDVNIPAMSEKIIQGKVVDTIGQTNDLFLIEQADVVRETVGIVAKTLVQGSNCVPLRIMNISDEPQEIRKGANLANMSPVCEVKSHCNKPVKLANVPEHLKDLYERTVIGMDTKQCNSVARLLFLSQIPTSEERE